MTEAECRAVRESVRRGRPLGSDPWVRRTAAALGLESSLRPRGRPSRAGGAPAPAQTPPDYPDIQKN
jgi:hypothetical protein